MKTIIETKNAPGAIGPYSQGTKIGNLVYTSGQLPICMETGKLEVEDIKQATKNSLENVKAILADQGAKMSDVIKTTVFVTDLADFTAVNEVYGTFFTENYPARSCVQVAALPLGAKIEIEVIACVD